MTGSSVWPGSPLLSRPASLLPPDSVPPAVEVVTNQAGRADSAVARIMLVIIGPVPGGRLPSQWWCICSQADDLLRRARRGAQAIAPCILGA